ncbi:M14 family metallopeptidase [Paenibacillus eucommiae]|uniref:G-D-glutamyl-meso-diaminopimelate peptidase n=1 Tax=Paenibacillus eucommiae TaxID=1355755 RepID=A0ABS4IP07_9BACL|nr:M14 family metallocarboxypeptidase [Paenibacillus eucommiae]MBP1989307.1 g-D-glutamyl-meso-diaminopimelate peptidase [Paenibacillus eucommiae]
MTKGYNYDELRKDLERLEWMYPFLRMESIGRSVLGKEIPAVRLGTGRRKIHYNAALHANEWITTPILMKFIEEAAISCEQGKTFRGKDMRRICDHITLWFVPMVNPDGVNLVLDGPDFSQPYYKELLDWNGGSADFRNWKSNIRGVDLNDQFPAHWEEERLRRASLGPGERDYGGPSPLSEPEAAAMAHFTCMHDFELVIALHTQGQEIYWNYRDMEPLGSRSIASLFAAASGYKSVRLSGSDAGYKDWFIQQFKRPGFTVEIGLGTNPLPIEMLPQLYEEALPILLEGLDA